MKVDRIDGTESSGRTYQTEFDRSRESERVRSEKSSSDFRKEESDRVEISSKAAEAERAASSKDTDREQVSQEEMRTAGNGWYRYGLPQALDMES